MSVTDQPELPLWQESPSPPWCSASPTLIKSHSLAECSVGNAFVAKETLQQLGSGLRCVHKSGPVWRLRFPARAKGSVFSPASSPKWLHGQLKPQEYETLRPWLENMTQALLVFCVCTVLDVITQSSSVSDHIDLSNIQRQSLASLDMR